MKKYHLIHEFRRIALGVITIDLPVLSPYNQPMAWYNIIGSETRCNPEWNRELYNCPLYSFLYSLSSLTFPVPATIAYFYDKSTIIEILGLSIIACTSFLSDVVYLGIKTRFRTLDTFVTCVAILYYGIFALTKRIYIPFIPMANALFFFIKSQKSTILNDRMFYHTIWHFSTQFALIFLYCSTP